MTIRLTISSDLFADTERDQEVEVRDDLLIRRLLGEICREFELSAGQYVLRTQAGGLLSPSQSVEQAGIKNGDRLIFSIAPAGKRIFLLSEKNHIFDLTSQPALLGRPDTDKSLTADMLAVNLTNLDPERTVSRPHARITWVAERFLVESVNENNLTYINEIPVQVGILQSIQHGDWLRLGKVKLQFCLEDFEEVSP